MKKNYHDIIYCLDSQRLFRRCRCWRGCWHWRSILKKCPIIFLIGHFIIARQSLAIKTIRYAYGDK